MEPLNRDADLPVIKCGQPGWGTGDIGELTVGVEGHFHWCREGEVKLLGQLVVLGLERDGDLPTDDLVDRSVIAQEKSGDMATITRFGNSVRLRERFFSDRRLLRSSHNLLTAKRFRYLRQFSYRRPPQPKKKLRREGTEPLLRPLFLIAALNSRHRWHGSCHVDPQALVFRMALPSLIPIGRGANKTSHRDVSHGWEEQ